MEDLERALEHFGVRGMKWGQRKRRDGGGSGSEPTDVIIKSRPGKGVEVSGGKNHMPSEDAKRAAGYQQKARASTIHSLSNEELKTLVTRMQLESNYAKAAAANAPKKGKGKAFIEGYLLNEGKAVVNRQKGPGFQIVEAMIKMAKMHRRKKAQKAASTAAKVLTGVVVNR